MEGVVVALLDQLKRFFTSKVQQRARTYFMDGAVSNVRQRGKVITATVQGGETYSVRINLDKPDDPEFNCTCPFFVDREESCKHLWATLLVAEENGFFDEYEDDQESESDAIATESMTESSSESATETAVAALRLGDVPMLRGISKAARKALPAPARVSNPVWKRNLAALHTSMKEQRFHRAKSGIWPEDKRLVYTIDATVTQAASGIGRDSGLVIELCTQTRGKDGQWRKTKRSQLDQDTWMAVPDEDDRLIAQMLAGARDEWGYGYGRGGVRRFVIPDAAYDSTLRRICQTGRCFLRREHNSIEPNALAWDDGPAWDFVVNLRDEYKGEALRVAGGFTRGDERLELSEPAMILSGGLIIANDKVARLNHHGAWAMLVELSDGLDIVAFKSQSDELLQELYALPQLPPLELPADLGIEPVKRVPKPHLRIKKQSRGVRIASDDRLNAELSFDYSGNQVPLEQDGSAIFLGGDRKVILRDREVEDAMLQRLLSLGFRNDWGYYNQGNELTVTPAKMPAAVIKLVSEGWQVDADGSLYRRAGEFKVNVSSGIDWFELNASVDFDGQIVSLPKLLAALQRGETAVRLDDGTLGVLPEEWLKKYATLADLGETDGETVKFTAAQTGFLDVLLSEMPEVNVDEAFERARKELRSFEGIRAADAPAGFVGELRPYQREGLGWLGFLQQFRFGGCLADDMGLGKTIQVLAMLEARRQAKSGPSLVVVPRSLVFNWMQESQRFTPQLRLLDHSGTGRLRATDHFSNYDLIITTYGTLRRDAGIFKDIKFDYVILDESQAIKNASTESAKAARLLRGNNRLAMSGTPIENHLGELWSLFEFLNPGMLGGSKSLKNLAGGNSAPTPEARTVLARALRPFILRRTKSQVARDLPDKTEQTIHCELDAEQRKLYDELRVHYRQTLLERVATVGMNKAKIQILEALLRLRQAACHPGLIDKTRTHESSAKLDMLLSQVNEVVEEGHKVLVFSQFTSLLAIVKTHLDKAGTVYEYLDGRTRDRQQRVERFQNDPTCKLFLISLKAGGVGLNLTSADYVYLLDPWWNPAVESQAIDRAHRIGQHRSVFAYRLIAKDTVEEKVLELQQSKRDLADAIINADNSVIGSLGREDLELLLS